MLYQDHVRHVKDMAYQACMDEEIEDDSIYLRDVKMLNAWGENDILTQNVCHNPIQC